MPFAGKKFQPAAERKMYYILKGHVILSVRRWRLWLSLTNYHAIAAIAKSDKEVQFWLGRNRYLLGEKHQTYFIIPYWQCTKRTKYLEKVFALQEQIIFQTKIFPSHVNNQHRGKLSCEQFEFAANSPLKTSAKIQKIASHLTSLKKTPYVPTLWSENTQYLLANEQKIFRTKACQIDS